MVDPPKKIIIVGEKFTGKTSMIKVFKDHEGTSADTLDSRSKSRNYLTADTSTGLRSKNLKNL